MRPISLLVLLFLTIRHVKTDNVYILDEKVAEMSVKTFHTFLYDQRIVSIIMTDKEIESTAYEAYKRELYNTHHFTVYDFIISNMSTNYQLPGTEKGMTPHSNTHCYLISSEILLGRQDLFENLFKQNPNAKWGMAVTKVIDEDTILRFYRKFWKLYNMAFLLTLRMIVNVEPPNNLITNISYGRFEKVLIYQFNPFEFNDDGVRGKLTKRDSSKMTTEDDWAKIFYFYQDLMDNLYQYTLKVVLGKDDLLMECESENKYKFPDGELVTTIMEKMNFKIERHLLGEDHLGGVYDNGTAYGGTALLEYDKVDIIGNSYLMTDMGTNNTMYLYPYQLSHIVFLAKKKLPKDRRLTVMPWQNYSYPLNYFHVLIFIISVLFLTISEILFQWKLYETKMRMGDMIVIVIDSATLIYGFLEESSRSLKKWTNIYQRLFLCGILLYAMLLTSVFKGIVVKDLSNALVSEDPMRVSDILDSDQGIIYFSTLHAIYRKFADDEELMINKLRKRRILCNSLEDCVSVVLKKDAVMLVRDSYAYDTRAQYWDNKTGSDLYHIVPEKPFSFFASITVNKGSPYVRKLNKMILQCTEAGIVRHGSETAKHSLKLKDMRRYLVGRFVPEQRKKPVNVQNIDMVLLIFFIMLTVSTIVFLCEVAVDKLVRKHYINGETP